MTRILAVFQSPEARIPPGEIPKEQAEAFKEAITEFVGAQPSVSWGGFYANSDGVGIAEWEATDVETIEQFYNNLEGVSPDAIVAVEKVL